MKGGTFMNLYVTRTEKGLTQLEVATTSGITVSYYSLIESGKRRPSVEIAKSIGNALGFSWQEFYDDTSRVKN